MPVVPPQATQPPPAEPPRPDAGEESEDVFVFPATAIQRRFWLLDQLVTGGNHALNMPLAVRLTGRLNVSALERGIQEVVRRHEILRTSFHCEKGQLRQVISADTTIHLPIVDVRDFPASERSLVPEHLQAEEARLPFDLARGPVIRARLVKLSASEHLLLVTLHHIVSDGWSNGVLLRELADLYAAYAQGRPSPLPELPIQFADYAQWQQDQAADAGPDDRLGYWRQTLAGELPALDLPANRLHRPARGRAPAGGTVSQTISSTQALKALAVREGVSVYMVHLAAFALLLNRYSGGQEDLLISTPSANRNQSEIEPLIGPFANPLLLRLDLAGDPSLRELLARVRTVVLGAFEHADAPFEKLLEEIQPRRLQVDFVYQNNMLPSARLPELEFAPLVTTSSATHGEWSVSVTENGAAATLSIVYNADLYDAETMSRVIASHARLLETFTDTDAPGTAVSSLAAEQPSLPESAQPPVLAADRWRLPAATARWVDACFDNGKTCDGIDVAVLDRYRQPSPVGVEGEIYLGHQPEGIGATLAGLERVECPGRGEMLRTGDLATVGADGTIHWLGRADTEVKLHGVRVETTGIETALQAHPHVVKAVVAWRGGQDGSGQKLVAHFQSDGAPPALVSHSQLRDFLRETLPEEVMPTMFIAVERFPLTNDGRLDAAALPDPAARPHTPTEEKYDAPYLTIHYQMIEIWREILGVPTVGIRDDFFALGGNSLLAMQMLYRVEEACGKALLPATLFQKATVEHLADEILLQDQAETAPEIIKICETGSKTPIIYLHGDLTGGGYYCMKLSRRLGPDQPFYAVPPMSGPILREMPSIERMAAAHIKAIQTVRPHGPYVLGGFCLGGLIAQEMACQLEAQRERVERLLIIDATVINRRLQIFRTWAERLGRRRGWDQDRQLYFFCRWHFLWARFNRWKGLGIRHQGAIVQKKVSNLFAKISQKVQPPKPVDAGPAPSTTDPDAPWFDPRWDVPLFFLWAIGAHVAKPCGAPTTLLLSRDLVVGHGDPFTDWKKFNPHLDTRELVGSHLACITEHADSLAETIRDCLEERAS